MQRRALIVDDTKNIRLMLTKCLELEGYDVASAGDGKAGLELALNEPYDLIFLDIKMPEMTGSEVLRQLRAQDIQTPVIVITAYATVRNALETTRLGAVSYLQKPFSMEKIRQVLDEFGLGQQRTAGMDLEGMKNRSIQMMDEGKLCQAWFLLRDALATDPMDAEIHRLFERYHMLSGDAEMMEKFRNSALRLSHGQSGACSEK